MGGGRRLRGPDGMKERQAMGVGNGIGRVVSVECAYYVNSIEVVDGCWMHRCTYYGNGACVHI